MSRVLLLEHPRVINQERCNDIANTPLTSSLLSGYVAGMLISQGHQVEIVEGYLDKLTYAEINCRISTFNPDIIGVNLVYHWKKDKQLFTFLAELKNSNPQVGILIYGFYGTFAYDEILADCAAVDAVLLGEAELPFAKAVQVFVGAAAWHEIRGVAYRDINGQVVNGAKQTIRDLDQLPFPVRTKALLSIGEVNIQGSRGCYGRCTFCYINPFYGTNSSWRGRSPENIIEEIDSVIAQYGKREFYFIDPNFFGPGERGQRRALKLAELLKERGISFGIEARVNDIHEETVGALAEAGLKHILIGLESGCDKALKRLNKLTTVAQNERAVKILRKYGIEPNIGFIMFEPDSSLEDIRVNFEFLQQNELLKNLPITANLLYHHQIVLRGTSAYQVLQQGDRLSFPANTMYEGTPDFTNGRVDCLAQVMRRITNFLFSYMAGIWSGRENEPEGAKEKYAHMNQVLVDTFAKTLTILEDGKELTEDSVEQLVAEAIENLKGQPSTVISFISSLL
ncbi:MAG: B12-binding domain-containing radical SAM protein [Clostridia bacterium]|nr:B12-binding domain-containing radical SAM protein [Clostridia bacterium]